MSEKIKIRLIVLAALLFFCSLVLITTIRAQQPEYHRGGVRVKKEINLVDSLFIIKGDTIFGFKTDTTGKILLDSKYYIPTIEYLHKWVAGHSGINLNNVPDYGVLWVREDTLSYDTNFTYDGDTLRLFDSKFFRWPGGSPGNYIYELNTIGGLFLIGTGNLRLEHNGTGKIEILSSRDVEIQADEDIIITNPYFSWDSKRLYCEEQANGNYFEVQLGYYDDPKIDIYISDNDGGYFGVYINNNEAAIYGQDESGNNWNISPGRNYNEKAGYEYGYKTITYGSPSIKHYRRQFLKNNGIEGTYDDIDTTGKYVMYNNNVNTLEINDSSVNHKVDAVFDGGVTIGGVKRTSWPNLIGDTSLYAKKTYSGHFYKNASYAKGVGDTNIYVIILSDSRGKPIRGLTKLLNTFDVPSGYAAFYGNGIYGDDYTVNASNTTYVLQDQNSISIGLTGEVTKFINEGFIHVTLDSSSAGAKLTSKRRTCNRIYIYYAKFNGGGKFRYRKNHETWDTVDTQNNQDSLGVITIEYDYMIDDLSFDLQHVSDSVYLYGFNSDVIFEDKKDKLKVDVLASGGLSLREINQYSVMLEDYIQINKPSQVHISFGSNDIAENRSVSDYISDVRSVISKTNKDSSINYVLWSQYDVGVGPPHYDSTDSAYSYFYEKQSDSLFALAYYNNYSFFDVRKLIGDARNQYESGFTGDGVHLNGSGDLYIFAMLRDIITPYCFNKSLFNKYKLNYATKGVMVLQSDNTQYIANEIPSLGFYRLSATGSPIETISFYSPNSLRLYLSINNVDLYQWRNDRMYCGTNLGVKTSAPIFDLDVNGTARIQENLYLDSPSHGIILTASNGTCYRVTVSDIGEIEITNITCP